MKLRTLYQRRLKLTRELAALNASIMILERRGPYAAPLKVHHVKGCGVGRRERIVRPFGPHSDRQGDNKKRTRDWAEAVAGNDIICAWGAHRAVGERGEGVRRLLHQVGAVPYHLGLTKAGHPRHPLYLPFSTERVSWEGP